MAFQSEQDDTFPISQNLIADNNIDSDVRLPEGILYGLIPCCPCLMINLMVDHGVCCLTNQAFHTFYGRHRIEFLGRNMFL